LQREKGRQRCEVGGQRGWGAVTPTGCQHTGQGPWLGTRQGEGGGGLATERKGWRFGGHGGEHAGGAWWFGCGHGVRSGGAVLGVFWMFRVAIFLWLWRTFFASRAGRWNPQSKSEMLCGFHFGGCDRMEWGLAVCMMRVVWMCVFRGWGWELENESRASCSGSCVGVFH